jgi:hypothetical protein
MSAIPHIEERKRLLALREQEEDLACEEEDALAPLKAEAKRLRDLPEARQGVEGDDIEGEMLRLQEPIKEAFTLRREKLQQEIDAVEKITGSLRSDDDGNYLTCAITGLPILETDEMWTVIAAAVPPKASSE